MGSINHLQAIRPDTAYIKKIIESSLLADWAVRIEYQTDESEPGPGCWLLWDKTHFAIRSAKPVLETLLDCYAKHPQCIIRLSAEKFRPQSRVLYTVYNPRHLPANTKTSEIHYSAQARQTLGQIPARLRGIGPV